MRLQTGLVYGAQVGAQACAVGSSRLTATLKIKKMSAWATMQPCKFSGQWPVRVRYRPDADVVL